MGPAQHRFAFTPPLITGFRITGLHGRRDVSVSISDNCVVLVGVNGLGKTTTMNILYYLLTHQWVRLIEYKFDAVAVDSGQTLSAIREQLEAPVQNFRLRPVGTEQFGGELSWRSDSRRS